MRQHLLHRRILMLTVRMPDGDQKKKRSLKRQRWDALGYVTAAGLICASLIISWDSPFWWVPVVVEVWWFWAATSQDWGE
jgi:hypothetical protein